MYDNSRLMFLCSEGLSRHDDLLSQLSSVKDADTSLTSIRSAVSTLQSSVRRIRSEIADPNRQIRSKTVQLSNLHFNVDLLQSTVRFVRLSKKLRDVMAEECECCFGYEDDIFWWRFWWTERDTEKWNTADW
ncbi:hypothetical protein QVD17_21801 [Tagetes erecta]|uniref:Conserved oligomeric Golgi complex subunit 5 N-terminal domain-containing protein n=1 Tax=Tagetes erecta TaxID=13708 RepID=A0AAD8NT75_TARER|nr:hypothetical protein QVD17_21801 [Tagetes erecta]